MGDLSGACSRRINIQHRLVYQVVVDIRVVKVLRMWSHYNEERKVKFGVGASHGISQGLITSKPMSTKSATSRVASDAP